MQMQKRFTIPNILSVIRVLMIPVIAVLYFSEGLANHYWYAAGVIVLSGLTDIADGFIARHFDMCSELGKILDPLADKLTQATVIVCLCINHRNLIFLAVILFAKELIMLCGALVLKKKEGVKTPAAKWWGKMSTAIIYVTIFAVVISDIFPAIPDMVIGTLVLIATLSVAFSFAGYYFKIYKQLRTK